MGEGLLVRGSMGFYGNGWVSDDDVSLSQGACRTSCREYEQHVINLDLIDALSILGSYIIIFTYIAH